MGVRAFGYGDKRRIGRRRQGEVLVDHEDSSGAPWRTPVDYGLAFTRRMMPYIPAAAQGEYFPSLSGADRMEVESGG